MGGARDDGDLSNDQAGNAVVGLHLPDWRRDQLSQRYAVGIPDEDLWQAHMDAKRALIEYVSRETNAGFDRGVLTIGFARRATAYKRGTLIFHDRERWQQLVKRIGAVQLAFAGKANPRDHDGKQVIRRIHEMRDALDGVVAVA